MVEGESGLLAIGPPQQRPQYEPTKRRLTWPNGAIATTYSADEPERLRGPQHDAAWCDEIASWRYPEAWDMLMFGLRLGPDPRVVVTTTPKPVKIIRELLADPTTVVTRGSSYENRANLADAFFAQIIRKYEGARLGRQEITGTASRKRGPQAIQCWRSGEKPPPGTMIWACGWWVSADPQVCSTAVSPMLAPRCLGSAAMMIMVSAAVLSNRS